MAYPNEQDPLLPKDERSPEIHGSRPVSINYTNADHDDDCHQHIADSEFDLPRDRTRSHRLDIVFFALQAFLVGIVLYLLVLVYGSGALSWLDGHIPRHRSVTERVNKILTDTPLIDGHNDLAIAIRALYNNHIYEKNFTDAFENGGMYGHVDLPRLKEGKVGGTFWAAYAPCPKNGSDFSDENYADAVTFTLSQIDVIKRLQSAYPTHFSPPPNGTTALSAFRNGQLISPIAIEGLHQIGNSYSTLRDFYDLGVRYATLTHNCHNIYADAALAALPNGDTAKATPAWGGVSPAGRKLIHEMNRIGMIVDLSHVSQDTMRDVLGGGEDWDGSIAPIIYSHSSAYAICPHPRNVPDDILQLVKKRKSVVMVNFAPDFISCVANASNTNGIPDYYPQNSTLEQVVEHIKYIGELIGYDHVGLGSDFDGISSTPRGLDDVSKYPDLIAELLRQEISDKDAKKIAGENLLRVWEDVDNVAKELQAKGEKPAEDDPPKLWGGP